MKDPITAYIRADCGPDMFLCESPMSDPPLALIFTALYKLDLNTSVRSYQYPPAAELSSNNSILNESSCQEPDTQWWGSINTPSGEGITKKKDVAQVQIKAPFLALLEPRLLQG